jgi:hypothetical protein
MSQAFATSSPPSRSARALHRAEDISSALKASVNVYKRQLVNEVLGPLVTEFVRDFGREGATPIHSARLQCQPSRSRPGRQIHQTLMLAAVDFYTASGRHRALPVLSRIARAEAYLTETVVVSSKRVVDGLNVPGSIPVLPCVHKHDTASIAWMLQARRAATPAHS